MGTLTRSICAIAAGALFVAACGTDENNGTADGGGETQSYTIVSYLDYSGPFANRGEPVENMQRMLVDWFNEERGPDLGVEIQYDGEDTGYDAGATIDIHSRKIEDDSVVAVVTFGSPNVTALQERLSGDGVPAVHGGPSYDLMAPGTWVFSPFGLFSDYFATAVQWYGEEHNIDGPVDVAVVTFDGSSGQDWVEGLKAHIDEGTIDASIVLEEYVPPAATDVGPNADRIMGADADVIILATTDQLQPLLIDELHDRGVDPTTIVHSMHEGLSLLELLGVDPELLEGTYEISSMDYVDTSTLAYQIYDERKDEFETRYTGDTLLHMPPMLVLLQAIERAVESKDGDRITGEDVFDQLADGQFDGFGLLDEIRFDNEEDPTRGATSVRMLQWEDGEVIHVGDWMELIRR